MLYLTLRHYEYVAAIYRFGSLSAAAEQVNVSQPAMSAALTRIEAHLGHPLFVRRRGAAMKPTPQGRRFAEQAEALLAHAARIENPSHPRPPATRLHLGCFVDLAPFVLARALALLRTALPETTVTFQAPRFEVLIAGLHKGRIDLALTYDLGLDAGFGRYPLFRMRPRALVAADHPLAARAQVSLAELARYPLILSEEGLSAQHVLGLFRRQGLVPVVAHRAATLELQRSLAAHGEGAGISYAAPRGGTSYDGMPLVSLPVQDPETEEPVILARHGTGPADPLVADAISVLTTELRGA
ncbi:LysR family transcriptional regulator [Pukyongiella litopenaei]|uniref:LysR family transcriptional regulator n=1 Tax=Pukyongiella litopenaei TaxID=2605946 RepID=A0A2S0MQN4_9RHOB|nr:LysR family transcriptional regulator [Pukyongiella litopenaei]AVO38147.1 LysR family transcriptional regulator [Pukyongiella litopenaei]